ncbi:MAG: hypothetical protein WDO19_02415 [Bacteroidota bacterium]
MVDTTVIVEAPLEEPKLKPVKGLKAKTAKKPVAKNKKGNKPKAPKVKKTEPVEEQETEIITDQPAETDNATKTTDSSFISEPSYNNYDKDYIIKKSLTAAWTQAAINDLFAHNPASSIATNPQYMKSIDVNAVASVWIDKPMDLYYNLIPSNFMYGRGLSNSFFNRSNNSWYKNFTAKIFLEEKQIRISSAVELTDEMVAMQQKMMNRKLNKKFLNYINSDSLLGYMTWAMDTKAYLESFPKMLENTYGRMGLNSDEYSLATEFISFIIDEDAISQLVKGDGMVLFNGLYPQQTTYTDYVYDENYKATPVEKTKTDTLPRFLLMFSSDENNFERKLINYGIKKETVKQRDGFYELTIPSSPMTFFFMNKEGIFFLTNSVADMQHISSGNFKANISKQEKKLLLAHNYTMFINPSKISGQIATTEIGAAENLSSAMNTFSKMGNIRAVMNPVKANVMSGELTMDVPANNRNSLKYIFDVFDSFIK